jgi:hypothetical protein
MPQPTLERSDQTAWVISGKQRWESSRERRSGCAHRPAHPARREPLRPRKAQLPLLVLSLIGHFMRRV